MIHVPEIYVSCVHTLAAWDDSGLRCAHQLCGHRPTELISTTGDKAIQGLRSTSLLGVTPNAGSQRAQSLHCCRCHARDLFLCKQRIRWGMA